MKCAQTSEYSNTYRAGGTYSTGTFLTFSPQSLYSGILLRASLWTRLAVRGRDQAMWSAFRKILSVPLCLSGHLWDVHQTPPQTTALSFLGTKVKSKATVKQPQNMKLTSVVNF